MTLHFHKRISDPIHGSIGLTKIESRVVDTPAFQRLRNVKQLGLAHYVFPNADYSRFSHSLGVCHITGRTMMALQGVLGHSELSDGEVQQYRLAGLLHDIGHYPYSHAMEEAIAEHYSSSLLVPALPGCSEDEEAKPLDHESAGERVLTLDSQLAMIESKPYWQSIADIFRRQKPPRFANLISSDLDADRIDYLMRTAHHTGLPYGNVDIEYLLSQIAVDDQQRICFRSRAIRAAEHLLVCRYFDYQQVVFNKTVAGMEWLLREVLSELLKRKRLKCSAQFVERAVLSGTDWYTFDDSMVLQRIRDLRSDTHDDLIVGPMVRAVLDRQPPKLVGEIDYIADRDKPVGDFYIKRTLVKQALTRLAERFAVPLRHWHVWDKPGIELTKVGSYVSISAARDSNGQESGKAKDKFEQALRIIKPGAATSVPIMELPFSLMSVLADKALYSMRVYVLLPQEKEDEKTAIIREIKGIPDLDWK